jgi:tRNA(Ile)-lysidine synthase
MNSRGEPIRTDELEGLFAHVLAAGERAGLAVSGGSDSTALMVLFADWLARRRADAGAHTVLTVDHGLRPESVSEAEAVAHHAVQLGFWHATLVWEGSKPKTGVQAAARSVRHQLLAEYASRHGIAKLLSAHTADDQAETLLMRLARGSGLDGLGAMAPLTTIATRGPADQYALTLARPLLDVTKARLRATLEARGVVWIEDPSNQSPAFERPRVRAARAQLESLGLTTDMLALSARRLGRARAALEAWESDFWSTNVCADACGFIRIDAPALRRAPLEIAVRVLSQAIALAGGTDEPVPMAKLEPIAEDVSARPAACTWTLARAKITATPECLQIEREPGREPLPVLTLGPDTQARWDGRFLVAAGPHLCAPVEVRALGAKALAELRRAISLPVHVPLGALRTVPGVWRDGTLIAVPNLDYWAAGRAREEISATFLALGNYNSVLAVAGPERLE